MTIEFNISGDGKVLLRGSEGYKEYTETDFDLTKEILDIIEHRFPIAFEALQAYYGHSPKWKYLAVRRFIKCNWGNDDEIIDIAGDQLNFETVKCPLRGECKFENTICNPKEETKISKREIEVLECMAEGLTSCEISDKLFISIHTVNNHRKNMIRKTGVKNPAELIAFAYKNRLIK